MGVVASTPGASMASPVVQRFALYERKRGRVVVGKVICPTCDGKGHIEKEKLYVDRKGKGQTAKTREPCPQCGWSGWIDE
jgi:ribosomal protein S27AE